MSAPGSPYDNAQAESSMKTLKKEEVDSKNYQTIEEARRNIGPFLETTYNRQRLHPALGYKSPADFERQLNPPTSNSNSTPPVTQTFCLTRGVQSTGSARISG